VGVEHLLRDINDPSTSTLALQIKQKIIGLSGLYEHLAEIHTYLLNVMSSRLPMNNQIVYNLQNIINLLPNLNLEELVRSMLVKTNDMHLIMYVSSLVRSVIALHSLLANKIKYRDVDDVLDRSAGVESDVSKPHDAKDKADENNSAELSDKVGQ
jgi:26S proteasome regulatory subunit N8